MKKALLFLFLFFLSFIIEVKGFDSKKYTNSHVVGHPLDYTVYWRLDFENNDIYLALKAKTTGWVGFGIAEITSGSMPGADIILGYVSGEGTYISDRWSEARVTPDEDHCQGVELVSGEETKDGYTILEVKRNITSTDPQDRSIVSGPNRVIFAYGSKDSVSYHGTTRRTDEITFYGQPLYSGTGDVAGDLTMDLRMSDFVVPSKVTQYACQTFAMPVDKEYTITQIEPIVNDSNIAHVHHFLAHICLNESSRGRSLVDRYQAPSACNTPLGNMDQGCVGILTAWAAGGGSTYTPSLAGFAMGLKSTSIKYIILEVHYNNPDGKGGYVDNSGLRLHYSSTPRKYEAGVLTLGDPFTFFDDIPARQPHVEYEAECLSECTQNFPHDITIFQSFPHMHQVGSKMWTTQWRDNQTVDQLGRVEFWTFDHQTVQELNVTIKRGDRLNTHCVYNTMNSATNISFGIASNQEMCMHFLSYYPRIMVPVDEEESVPYSFCGKSQDTYSICGAVFSQLEVDNPLNRDPPGGTNTTFGVSPAECTTTPSLILSPSTSLSFLPPVAFLFAAFVANFIYQKRVYCRKSVY